ncbi:MAG: glycosyltransferase family 39 protein, partial [Candidatus Azambacteria bacterium]|nr:glycosyltransferase family 39 protein [Candidatus Azambacteria bacterium]
INPEHPPLLKDISGLPLLFLDLNFPETSAAWQTDLNGQWKLGELFLYESGNNPDQILFWARLGPMLLTILFGFLLFRFGKEWFGSRVALLALTLFALSPALLAHGKYVTTDVAAAFGFFLAIAYFIRYLYAQNRHNLIAAGIAFGVAQALKFSLVLLVPLFIGFIILWAFAHHGERSWKDVLAPFWRLLMRAALIFTIGYVVIIWPLYQIHVWNYPAGPATQAERQEIVASKLSLCRDLDTVKIPVSQYRDTVCNLKTFRPRVIAETFIWMSDKPILRPYAQYALGVLMVGQRAVGGNTTYFLGEVARDAWWYYFPVVYLLKEPLAMHILSLAALLILLGALRASVLKNRLTELRKRVTSFTKTYFIEIVLAIFVAFYWTSSIAANLNIGIRHVIPTFPFVFLLVSRIILGHLRKKPDFAFTLEPGMMKQLISFYVRKAWKYVVLFIIIAWYVISVLMHYPYYITYFNELAGGPTQGFKYVADSNLDWGQDLKRLVQFTNENNIDTIRVHYFGGGSPQYYLGDKFVPWWSSRGPESGWYAISATFLAEAFGTPVGRYTRSEQDSYLWLRDKTPVTVIGHSIFVYKID